MVQKQNCWEYEKCGREPKGSKSKELGVCPAATNKSYNRLNEGENGGRMCWAIAGTLCGGKVQGTFAEKRLSCMTCDFYKKIKKEEGKDFQFMKDNNRYKEY